MRGGERNRDLRLFRQAEDVISFVRGENEWKQIVALQNKCRSITDHDSRERQQ